MEDMEGQGEGFPANRARVKSRAASFSRLAPSLDLRRIPFEPKIQEKIVSHEDAKNAKENSEWD